MRFKRFEEDARPEEIRDLASGADVEPDVRAILDEVRRDGDAAIRRLTERFDRVPAGAQQSLRVAPAEIEAAAETLDPHVLGALRAAIANVGEAARAQVSDGVRVELAEGQRVDVVEVAVRRAGAYVPGGRAPYPSTVVMCALTARAAGVEEVAVCAPPDSTGAAQPTILAACRLCGVSEVYRMGGAQAIAALAYGTESVAAVDVIVGPGNSYVQEAKRQLTGSVGIDSLAGPTELVVAASAGAEPELIALDLLAQAEHGPESLLALISDDPDLLEAVETAVGKRLASGDGLLAAADDVPLALVRTRDSAAAVELADRLAPEHLQLAGEAVEQLAPRVRCAGCLFVGRDAGTAFGDYIVGSNHVLPTGGRARFQSVQSVATFRRRMARVSLSPGAGAKLAPAGAVLASAEGFPLHAESMARRA